MQVILVALDVEKAVGGPNPTECCNRAVHELTCMVAMNSTLSEEVVKRSSFIVKMVNDRNKKRSWIHGETTVYVVD